MGLIVLLALLLLAVVGSVYLRPMWRQGPSGQIKVALIVIGVLFILAAASGRANGLFLVIGAALTQLTRLLRFLPLILRYLPFLRNAAGAAGLGGAGGAFGGTGSRQSRIETPFLRMCLDHASGRMDGEVLQGEFSGRALSSLADDELGRLRSRLVEADAEGVRLFDAWLARSGGAEARSGSGASNSAGEQVTLGAPMSTVQAYEVLGLEPGASREDIIAAHRSLIGKMHPDKGGSAYLASVINGARDRLLAELN